MTGGAFRNSSNLLGRKRELEEIEEKIKELDVTLEKSRKELAERKNERESLKERKDTVSEKLQGLSIKKNTFTLNFEQASKNLEECRRIYTAIRKELSDIGTQINDINANKEELFDSNKKQEQAVKELEDRIALLEEQLAQDRRTLENNSEELQRLNLDFNTVAQQNDFLMQNINRVKGEAQTAKIDAQVLRSRLRDENEELKSLNDKTLELEELSKENIRIISIKEQKLTEYINNKQKLNESHKEFFNQREKLSEQINGLDKAAFKLNASIEKLNEQSEVLNNYMWEEYELTYNNAKELRDETLDDVASLKREISAVKSKIKQLGDVNVNAIEDYKQVSERYEFLKAQHDDIVNLLSIIEELDRAMKEQFSEKFKDIRTMFSKVFKELFGGGKADLELVDEENLLETGIKIIAQPPGKKLQNMMQLSGGEKSLTAISLLFAIQSLKPSPFCLLDEIEAALDDSNVKRFARYLHKLTKDTQFIVITHRKGTMEAADILYGITMQEKGVSTLVSVKMIEDDLDD